MLQLLAVLLELLLARPGPGMPAAVLLAVLGEFALGGDLAEGDSTGRASGRFGKRETGKDGLVRRQLVVCLIRLLVFARG